jgi:hypothetical protein
VCCGGTCFCGTHLCVSCFLREWRCEQEIAQRGN